MSWEVSSMQSKRSFFNRTLFRKNLGRFWPLWGGVSLLGSMVPLYILLSLLGGAFPPEQQDFAEMLYMASTGFAPAFTLCYAVVVAMVVWSYLYTPRSVGLMHTLPIDRTGLFITNTLSGLAMLLIPYVIVGGLLCLLALCWGFFDLMAAVNAVLAVLLMTVLFFGLATLCAMACGHLLALPAFYFLLSFLAPALDVLVTSLAGEFIVGLQDSYSNTVTFLSPVMQIYESFSFAYEKLAGDVPVLQLHGLWVVAVYGLVGAALLAAAWGLYRARGSESAGDVVAFRWLRPVFRYGVALLSALTVGRLAYELLWVAAGFQRGRYADPAPMAVCLAAAGVIGYYAASMLLEKSLRVFRGSWRGVALVCAASVGLVLCLRFDMTGVESRAPDMGRIETVEVGGTYLEHTTLSAAEDGELVEQVLALHRAVVDSTDALRSVERPPTEEDEYWWGFLYLNYEFMDGSTLRRGYTLPIAGANGEEAGAYDPLLRAFIQDPVLQVKRVSIPAGGRLHAVYLCDYNSGIQSDVSEADSQALYDALLRDARSGNTTPNYFGADPAHDEYEAELVMEYRIAEGYGFTYRSGEVRLRPAMTNTLAALVDMGYLTEAEISYWDEMLRAAH